MLDLSLDSRGQLVYRDSGSVAHTGIEVIRSFPLSDPRHGLALVDGRGKELVWVESLDELPADQRNLLDEALSQREFVPVIEQILSISTATEPSEWEVRTNRGKTRFILNSEDDVHRLDGMRALLKDKEGIRYLIGDLEQLDSTSKRLLERYI